MTYIAYYMGLGSRAPGSILSSSQRFEDDDVTLFAAQKIKNQFILEQAYPNG